MGTRRGAILYIYDTMNITKLNYLIELTGLCKLSGTGSEMIGCLLAGWEIVIGVEIMPLYAHIARKRIAGWMDYIRHGQRNVNIILEDYKRIKKQEEEARQKQDALQMSFI